MKFHHILPCCILALLLSVLVSGCRKTSQNAAAADYGRISELSKELRTGYGTADTAKVYSLLSEMFAIPAPAGLSHERHVYLLSEGLTDLMYSYYYARDYGKGHSFFFRLAHDEHPALPVTDEFKRYVLILAGYLAMHNSEQNKAVACVEEARQYPESTVHEVRCGQFYYTGGIYSQSKELTGKSVEMYEKALEESKLSVNKGKESGIMGNLAELYGAQGDVEKAIKMYYDCLDLFMESGQKDQISMTYASLADLYRRLGMLEEADLYVDKGVQWARQSGDLYYMAYAMVQKYEIANVREQPDSVLYWLERADSCCVAVNSFTDHCSLQSIMTQQRMHLDSTYVDEAVAQLEAICANPVVIETMYQPFIEYRLGDAYLLAGRTKEGIRLIEKASAQLTDSEKNTDALEAYQTLARHYRREGDYNTAFGYVDKATELREEIFKQEKLNQITASRIRYETTQKELENKVLQQRVKLKQNALTFTWILVALLALLLIAGFMYLRQRRRYHRRVSEARLSQISGLLRAQQELKENNDSLLSVQEELRQSNAALSKAQQELARHNASLVQELHVTSRELEKTSSELENTSQELDEVSSRLNTVSKQKAISDIRVKISTENLNSDKEAEFRRSFTAIYPDYLPSLHRLSTDMTPTDELIAMLLLLELSNNEIALTLGISKNGVNKARSRMRQRMGLKSEVVLEEFLKGIMG